MTYQSGWSILLEVNSEVIEEVVLRLEPMAELVYQNALPHNKASLLLLLEVFVHGI